MRPEVKKWFKIVFCTLMVVFSVSIGFSDWVYPDNSGDKTTGNGQPTQNEIKPCAYIDNNTSVLYTIEDALSKAASLSTDNVVYVIPGTNPTIYKNCTIAKGDTLCVSNGHARVTDQSKIGVAEESGALSFAYDNASKLKNTIVLAPGIKLTVYGTIELNGVLSGGAGGQYGTGQTSGDFCKITLGKNSIIDNYGTIYSFGFIDGSEGVLNSYSGSKIDVPFVINDFKGGNITTNIATIHNVSKKRVSYFDMFEINNLMCFSRIYFGTTVICHANIYTGSMFHSTFELVGTNGLFKLTDENCCLELFVDNSNDRIEYYTIFGSLTMGNISVSLNAISVSSDSFDLPFSYRQHIECKPYIDGTQAVVDLPHYYKLLPGSFFRINSGVTLNCSNRLYVYPKGQFFQKNVGGKPYTTSYLSSPSTFIVNGNFVAKEFGGLIQTECKGATIKVTSSVSPTIREHTDTKYVLKLPDLTITKMNAHFQFYAYSNGQVSSTPNEQTVKNTTYVSNGTEATGYGFE